MLTPVEILNIIGQNVENTIFFHKIYIKRTFKLIWIRYDGCKIKEDETKIKKRMTGSLRTLFIEITEWYCPNTVQKMKFSIKDLFRKCDQIRRKLRVWSLY